MIYKIYYKWLFKNKIWVCFRFSTRLWHYPNINNKNEKKTVLFLIGYDNIKNQNNLYYLTILFFTFQLLINK